MGRVSRGQAQQHRDQIVAVAARRFREHGIDGVSIADIMKELNLTHGGFYKHFPSKEALLEEATRRAFADLDDRLEASSSRHGDHAAARAELIDYYLSAEHRDDVADGCPTTGFSSDLSRSPAAAASKEPYAVGVEDFARWLAGSPAESAAPDSALREVAMLVGALVLARATAGTDLSDRVLAAVRGGVRP